MCLCKVSRRQVLTGAVTSLGTLAIASSARAQVKLTLAGTGCSMFGSTAAGREIVVFESSAAARVVVADICSSVGLAPNFEVKAIRDPRFNAYAVIDPIMNEKKELIAIKRYIVYDEDFMNGIADKGSRDWSGLTVLAHEIGHHLHGHTLTIGSGSRPPIELEADLFAGFAVARIGGRLFEATRVFQSMSEAGSETHPPRAQRISAVTAGWKKATGEEERYVVFMVSTSVGEFFPGRMDFVRQKEGGKYHWTQYRGEEPFAILREVARDERYVFLYDTPRSRWWKIDILTAQTALLVNQDFVYWADGESSPIPSAWTSAHWKFDIKCLTSFCR